MNKTTNKFSPEVRSRAGRMASRISEAALLAREALEDRHDPRRSGPDYSPGESHLEN